MKKYVIVLLLMMQVIDALPGPETKRSIIDWYHLIRVVSFLFPYTNLQPFTVDEEEDKQIKHSSLWIFAQPNSKDAQNDDSANQS